MNFQKLTKVMARTLGLSSEKLIESYKPATATDIDKLLEFRKQNLGNKIKWDDTKYLNWRYNFDNDVHNPNFNNKIWILKIDGQILATCGTQSFDINIESSSYKALHPLDLLVAERLKGKGLGAWIQFALKDKCEIMMIIGANDNSRSLVKRAFLPMPNRQVWKLLLKMDPLFFRLLPSKAFSRLFGLLVNIFYRQYRYFRYGKAEGMDIKKLELLPDAIDQFNLNKQKLIFTNRTAKRLNWRYMQNPGDKFECLGIYYNEKIVAYFIYKNEFSESKTFLTAKVVDYFWFSEGVDQAGLLNDVFIKVSSYFTANNYDLLEVPSYGNTIKSVLKNQDLINRSGEFLFSLDCNDERLKEKLSDHTIWFLTDADAHGASFD